MDKKRLLELAGIKEAAPETTRENPLVYVWEKATSKDYPEQGLDGHMHLSTAANIHRFKTEGLAKKLFAAGEGKRVKAGPVYLELSQWTKKELKEDIAPVSRTAVGEIDDEKNMRRNPHVTLMIYDPTNPLHNLELRGLVVEMTEIGAVEHLDQLTQRYLRNPDARFFGDSISAAFEGKFAPVKITIAPTRIRIEG